MSAGPSALYLRINPDAAQSAVSAGKCTEAEKACTIAIGAGEAIFRGANEQGTKALYSEKEGSEGEKLFEVDIAKAIAYEPAPSTLVAGKVRGLMGMSDDLSRVYLVSSEDRDGAGPAKAGDFNLYLYEAGAGFTFVARLLGTGWKSEPSGSSNDKTSADVRSISPFPVNRGSRVSGDGLQAAFMSDSPALAEEAAGYDNSDANSGEADSEVYLFDAGEGKLRCVSCNPGGGRPEGRDLHPKAAPKPGPQPRSPAGRTSGTPRACSPRVASASSSRASRPCSRATPTQSKTSMSGSAQAARPSAKNWEQSATSPAQKDASA